MKIDIQTVNFNAQDTLLSYINQKVEKLATYYDKMMGSVVYLKVENIGDKKNKFLELKLEIPGDDVIVKKSGQSFEECIDLATDTAKKLIIKAKEKDKK